MSDYEDSKGYVTDEALHKWIKDDELEVTDNINEALYIMRDGTMISGTDSETGIRGLDHMCAQDIISEGNTRNLYGSGNGVEKFWQALHAKTGLIRYAPETETALIGEGQELTDEQLKALSSADYKIENYTKLADEANWLNNEGKKNRDTVARPNITKESDKPIIFYTNPPYGTSGNLQKDGSSKIKMANSKVNDYMKKNSFGKATQQLYAQFYARILKMVDDFQLKNVYIAFFNNSRNYCGGDYWEKFNNKLFSKFTLEKGNMFNAGEFSDTSDTWPITFSVFKLRSKKNIDLSNLEFHLSVEKSEIKDGITQINKLQNKSLRPIYADRALSEWMKEPLKNGKYVNLDMGTFPELSSAMGESKRNKPQGKLYKGSLGYIMNSANNIGEGTINGGVWLATSAAYHGHGVNVMPENFNRVIVNFAARRAVEPTWINAQDNFSYPNTKKNGYQTFENDCLVYSIFDTASNQAAYRNWKNYQNTNIKGKWINNWFWLKRDFVLEHAENINQAIIYDDARGDTDRFVANEIERRNFSPEAKNVLDLATNVWIEQLQYRDLAINDLPGKSLNAWDAGWYQMKLIQKNYPTRSMNKLQEAIKGLKHKIAKQVIYYEMLALDK